MALTASAALDALRGNDLIALGMEADALRRALHPQNTVTYFLQDEALHDCLGEEGDPFRAAASMKEDEGAVAALTIGRGESYEERIAQLEEVRRMQDDSGHFVAFELCVYHPESPQARREEEATAVDYLKTLAVARLMLPNIAHIQTSWNVQGPKVLELALRFGADDAGAIPARHTVPHQPSHHGGEAELRRIIRDAGFTPVVRDLMYTRSFLHV